MLLSATLTIEKSSTSMKEASPTSGTASQGDRSAVATGGASSDAGANPVIAPPARGAAPAARRSRSPDLQARRDGHAGAEKLVGGLRIVEQDLHRHALHHLHVIAAGILRRQQAES